MTAWREWLVPGLFVTFCLTIAAWLMEAGSVHDGLTGRTAAALRTGGYGWASVATSGRDAVITGTAQSAAEQDLALATARRVWGVRRLVDRTELLPLAQPFVLTVERAADGIVVRGSRPPGESSRLAVAALVEERFPGLRVANATSAARGAPVGFFDAARHALDVAVLIDEGRVSLSDLSLSVEGRAADSVAFDTVGEFARTDLVPGASVAALSIRPPLAGAYVLEAAKSGAGIVLSGHVPNTGIRAHLMATVEAAVSGGGVQDGTSLASGEPAGFTPAAEFALRILGRLAEGRVRLVVLDLEVEGVAATVEDYEALLVLGEGAIPAGVRLVRNAVSPAVISPYFWRAERAGNTVRLAGYMPSNEARRELLSSAAALLPGLAVVDQIRIAAGTPRMDWVGAAEFGLSQVALIGQGSVTIDGGTLSVSGAAATHEAQAALLALSNGTLPASLRLGRVEVSAPLISPYRIEIARRGGQLSVEGYLPTEEARQALHLAATNRFGPIEIVDTTAFGAGAPEGFVTAVDATLLALSRLDSGRAVISDRSVWLEGDTFFPGAADLIRAGAGEGIGAGFTLSDDLRAAPPGEALASADCQSALNAALESGQIQFQAGETSILPQSFGLLDRLIAILFRCPDTLVEIGGHTDADGAAAYNRTVSLARAESVRDYLVSAGLVAERLEALGYGESRPIAPNSTVEDKARNRRIEVTVKERGL